MFVKVCGITTPRQIDWAIELGYDAVGFVLYKKSKRFLNQNTFEALSFYAKNKIKTVAVSKDFNDLKHITDMVDYVQFYYGKGFENLNPEKIIFAGNKLFSNNKYAYFLYDISLGSGEFHGFPNEFNVDLDKLIIAGGLNPENIKSVLKKIKPAGVDVSSGVENSNGKKDFEKMKAFIRGLK